MSKSIQDSAGSAAFRLGHYAGIHWHAYRTACRNRCEGAGTARDEWSAFSDWTVARSSLRIFLATVGDLSERRDRKRRLEIRQRAGEGFRAALHG